MDKSVKGYRQLFSSIFRSELNAVEARRRRNRIEQTLGSLPMAPTPLPSPRRAGPPAEGAPQPALDAPAPRLPEILEKRDKTEKARRKLADLRRRSATPSHEPSHEPPPSQQRDPKDSPVIAAAREYHQLAHEWYTSALLYRDEMLRKMQSVDVSQPQTDQATLRAQLERAESMLKQAESILQSAAKTLADAAMQVKREVPDIRRENAQSQPARQEGPETQLNTRLAAEFGQVLAWEAEAQKHLESLCVADEDKIRAEEALREAAADPSPQGQALHRQAQPALADAEERIVEETEKWREALYQLAQAEQLLFQKASTLADAAQKARCRAAADAAEEEVQKRLRELNEARSPSPPAPPSGEGAASSSPPPPSNPSNPRGLGGQHTPPPSGSFAPGGLGPPDGPLAMTRKAALGMDLVGLALSGGGIRSATFGLGVLQGLAQLRLLGMIDYLSTVSGGGYIGSWLAAWVRREGGLANVEKQLSPNRISQSLAARYEWDGRTRLDSRPRDEEPEPIHHLRAYSRYLSPHFGAFAGDTWTLFTIYLRNLFVNSLFFLPLAVSVVFFWRLLMFGYLIPLEPDQPLPTMLSLRFALTALFGIAFFVGSGRLAWEEENIFEADKDRILRDGYSETWKFTHILILFPLFIVALLGPWIFSVDPGKARTEPPILRYYGWTYVMEWFSFIKNRPFIRFFLVFLLLALVPSLIVRVWRWGRRCWMVRGYRPFNWTSLFTNLLLAGFFGLTMYFVLWEVIQPWSSELIYSDPEQPHITKPITLCLLHSLGVPLTCGAMVLAGFVEMALVGRWLSEYEREWRSRLAAFLLMGTAAWLLMSAIVFLLPWFTMWLLPRLVGLFSSEALKDTLPTALKSILAALWAAISGGGAWMAQRSLTQRQEARPGWVSLVLITIAPAVFLIGLGAGVSAFGQNVVNWLADQESLQQWFGKDWAGVVASSEAVAPPDKDAQTFLQQAASWPGAVTFVAAVSFVLFWALGFFINVNRFSMHMLYANRLARCYLGASTRKQRSGSRGTPTGVNEPFPPSPDRTRWPRLANLFTGFDPLDDFPLTELRTIGGSVPYAGPIPLINGALNCLAGDELAYQDRRADSFLFTPQWCGGLLTGYARTPHKRAAAANLTLGRVMTISGAAVDPNMSHISPPLTALMTLFNTRLGWWLENPDPKRRPWKVRDLPWGASEPGLGFRLLGEFLGQTNADSAFVHISDGGHFENLGVYELIRRRCRFIIVADAGTDRVAASDNMAAMLGLIRTDFGVELELDPSRMQLSGSTSYSNWHCCVGRIRYDEVDDEAVPGLMIYLQATITGDEPPDLLQYVARHPNFPRQSTLDQFFDDAQFEAYRVLGHHIVTEVFTEAAAAFSRTPPSASEGQKEVRSVFARIREQWLPPLDYVSAEWIAAAQTTLGLEQKQGSNAALDDMAKDTYQEVSRLSPPPAHPLPEFRAVSQTLQVMEMAWKAMKLDAFHAHPSNRGWMNTLRRWTTSKAFQRYWSILRSEYSRPFVRFCEDILNLEPTQVTLRRLEVYPPTDLKLADLNPMDQQFTYEWADEMDSLELPLAWFPRQGFIMDLLAGSVKSEFCKRLGWLIDQGDSLPCGVIGIARTHRQWLFGPPFVPNEEAEFFVWLKGPYRSMGIGRQAADEALQQIDEELAFQQRVTPIRRLVTYYPQRDATAGCRLELERWMNFCFDLGFRRIRQPSQGLGAKFVMMKREIV